MWHNKGNTSVCERINQIGMVSTVLTCTATQVAFLRWTSVPGVLDRSLFPGSFGTDSARVVTNPYTLTLVNVTNHILDDEIEDLTSTLEVMVDI